MRDIDENGWESSAPVWIARSQEGGDFSRQHVLDRPMLDRVVGAAPINVLDIGCGEGRFCRMMQATGAKTVGLDPVPAMIKAARAADPSGTYVQAFAETLPFDDMSFDMSVCYLSLIDIDDVAAAIGQIARVLRPGGRILMANLSNFAVSSAIAGRRICKETGEEIRPVGDYLKVQRHWFEWDGLSVRNWHRPLSHYMQAFLQNGLQLTYFDEPHPYDCTEEQMLRYAKMPYLVMIEWQKPL